ncbi:MAG: type IV secretion system DNA-binding domain-containing protein [Bdellovibrionales bacterium]
MMSDEMLLAILVVGLGGLAFHEFYNSLSPFDATLLIVCIIVFLVTTLIFAWDRFSKYGRDRRKRLDTIRELPSDILSKSENSVYLGREVELEIPLYFPDSIRSRHIHILGATGSGKTESIVLNFLKQDVERGKGAIVLDAKGDASFSWALKSWVPEEKLRVFDLGSEESLTYDPLAVGTPHEAAQRLFSSLTWSEEYYKSKAFSALQKLFESHFEKNERNPKLTDLLEYLEDSELFISCTTGKTYPKKLAERDFGELSGLRDQLRSLCTGYLSKILSPEGRPDMNLEGAQKGCVLYFRLQSLMSPQIVATLGKLLINHLNFLAGTAHRNEQNAKEVKLIPTYLDEFASFACPEFADLISKARSAGLALHFSHQSIGDLTEVSKGFLNRITDNSATKIVMRINDPDSADFFARSFGTKLYQKVTQRVTNTEDIDAAEVVGEGSQREAHQFRASPDLFKTLPTGMGSVLIAHGQDTPHGASSVFKVRFPQL